MADLLICLFVCLFVVSCLETIEGAEWFRGLQQKDFNLKKIQVRPVQKAAVLSDMFRIKRKLVHITQVTHQPVL